MGIRWLIKYHIGSLTLASFIMPIVKVFSIFVDFISGICPSQKAPNSDVVKPISLSSTVHGINNCSISLMTFSGSDLIKSSHILSMLSYEFPSLHKTAQKANSFILMSGVLNCCVLPSFIGYILIEKVRNTPLGMFVSTMIMILSFLTVIICLSILT
jgi:hypothetical protein